MDAAKMNNINISQDKIILNFKKAKQEFELYEKFYLGLSVNAKQYLKQRSGEYKNILLDIQKIILPSVIKKCPTCKILCCKLYTPELSINISGTVGGFGFIDYLLIRCDIVLPSPNYENAERNLCPFFANGCILDANCRSYRCIRYFCDDLKIKIDAEAVSEYLNKLKFVIDNFSVTKCMV
jgi:hypothetical protein